MEFYGLSFNELIESNLLNLLENYSFTDAHLFANRKSASQRQNQRKDFCHQSAKSQIIGQWKAIHYDFDFGNAGTFSIKFFEIISI